MPRPKPFKTIDELVDLLTIERELKCANVDELRAFLMNTNYETV